MEILCHNKEDAAAVAAVLEALLDWPNSLMAREKSFWDNIRHADRAYKRGIDVLVARIKEGSGPEDYDTIVYGMGSVEIGGKKQP